MKGRLKVFYFHILNIAKFDKMYLLLLMDDACLLLLLPNSPLIQSDMVGFSEDGKN
jgi:hypothetical protein